MAPLQGPQEFAEGEILTLGPLTSVGSDPSSFLNDRFWKEKCLCQARSEAERGF